MDIAERRIPLDGRFGVVLDGKGVDFRVATLPLVHGELAVLRLLRKDSILMSLKDLGFLEQNMQRLLGALALPYGAILVTGPTGSGKSTTLYAAINETNDPKSNLITVEDPVEYRLPGLSQVHVNEKAGLTFAAALRSILRQDPDKVMIGEIRDRETGHHRHRGRLDRPPRALDPAHQRRSLGAHASHRDGHRAVPHGIGGHLGGCTATRATPVP